MPKHPKKPPTPSESEEEEVPSSLESVSEDDDRFLGNNALGNEDLDSDLEKLEGDEDFEEEGEDDMDDELAASDEEGEEEASEDNEAEGEQKDTEKEEVAEPADEDVLTNIEAKRDAAIKSMLSKEDLGIINIRIKETVRILSNLQELREKGKSRNDYMQQLKEDISQSYDYNLDLLELLFDLFPPAECLEFIEANEN